VHVRARVRLFCLIGLALCACAGVAKPGVPAIYEGYFEYRDELPVFHPCDSDERWWVKDGGAVQAQMQGPQYLGHHAEFEGVVTERGEYGRLGAYERELEVREVRYSGGIQKACNL
jgi:hypothetical protein